MNALTSLDVIQRRWRVLSFCLLVAVAGALASYRAAPPVYQSSTTLIVSQPQSGGVNEALQGVQLSSQLLQSFAAIATSRTGAARVRDRLGLGLSPEEVRARLSASPQPETLLLSISAVDSDPLLAQALANEAAGVLVDEIERLAGRQFARVQASVVDAAQPGGRVGPVLFRYLAVGLLVGVTLGVAAALLRERLDHTLRTAGDVVHGTGLPVLAVIPRQAKGTLDPSATLDHRGVSGEAFRALRTAVLFAEVDHPINTLLVTSAAAGDGKTTVATNLAAALAQGGQSVIIVDGDLRNGRVTQVLGLPPGPGVSSVILSQISLDDALVGWRQVLTVLGSGPFPQNPSELIGSYAMGELLEDLRTRADVVIIDGAPVLPVTDSVVLATQVDAVLLVTRHASTTGAAAAEARRRLDAVGAHVLGAVLNATTSSTESYDAYGGYSPRPTTPSNATRPG